jgi:hypothetical protein
MKNSLQLSIRIVLLNALLFVVLQNSHAQSSELEKISLVVDNYFSGMITRDAVKLEKAFHPDARLIGYRGDQFTVTSFKEWLEGVKNGNPRNPDLYQNHLLAIEIKGYTAIAKTELYWPGIYYYDYLTLIKVDGDWKIVHKTWYEEMRPQ